MINSGIRSTGRGARLFEDRKYLWVVGITSTQIATLVVVTIQASMSSTKFRDFANMGT
jgi:hypothetical protein